MLTKDAVQIVLPNPSYPGELRPGRPQVKNAAIGGRVVVSDLGDGTALRQPRLSWQRGLAQTDFDAMEGFLENTVNRSELTFDFTDWEGATMTVVYWDGLGEFQLLPDGRHRGTIVLREVPT